MKEQYVYGVARIHVREQELLTHQDLEQLLTTESYDEAIQFLADKGYQGNDIESMLTSRRKLLWEFLTELGIEEGQLKVFRYDVDFHNLKAAIKSQVMSESPEVFVLKFGSVPAEQIISSIRERNFENLPEVMRDASREALDVLLQTRDGQRCDMILDRALLEAILKEGNSSEISLIRNYAQLRVALTDIQIAVRCCQREKTAEFIYRALAKCESLDISTLSVEAAKGLDSILNYLSNTSYYGAMDALKTSMSSFEKWCDNRIIELIRPEKNKSFTLGPVVGYLLAVENEMKIVRLILTGKLNRLKENLIRERVRDIYG